MKFYKIAVWLIVIFCILVVEGIIFLFIKKKKYSNSIPDEIKNKDNIENCNEESFKKIKKATIEDHPDNIYRMSFKEFKNYFIINPKRWNIRDIKEDFPVYYGDPNMYCVFNTYEDYEKYRKFIKYDRIYYLAPDKKLISSFLKDIQKDIDNYCDKTKKK